MAVFRAPVLGILDSLSWGRAQQPEAMSPVGDGSQSVEGTTNTTLAFPNSDGPILLDIHPLQCVGTAAAHQPQIQPGSKNIQKKNVSVLNTYRIFSCHYSIR